ncbi:hypothetical protein MHUMG1_04006 [Metarhizium humberi]|uniref:Uncharacterized protein n=1 Tax=Metarhizium humberi TaxID=2596975 RepID=A0A9P8MEA5_9HYPO|nr:hypothetical protein MHUMG1_04006 [Metarhizium humberi]
MYAYGGYIYFGAVCPLSDLDHDKESNLYRTNWAIHMFDEAYNRWCFWKFRRVGPEIFTYGEEWIADAPKIAGPAASILFGKVRRDKLWAALYYMRRVVPWDFRNNFHVMQYLIYICKRLVWVFEDVEFGEEIRWFEVEKVVEDAISSIKVYRELDPTPSCRACLIGKRSVLDIVRRR